MKKIFSILTFISITCLAVAQKSTPIDEHYYFKNEFLTGFTQVSFEKSDSNPYDRIFISDDKKAEVRYAFRPDMKDVKDDNLPTYATAILLNISKDQNPNSIDLRQHKTESVKKDYNGTSGYFAIVENNTSFSSNYKLCLAFVIHKENVGSFIIYLLINDQDDLGKENYAETLTGKVVNFK